MLNSIPFPWLLALVVFAYLFCKHRKFRNAIEGVISNLIGYYMIILGAGLTQHTLAPMNAMVHSVLGVHGGIMNSEVFAAELLMLYALPGFLVLFLSFFVNLLLARFTRARGMYLTGHHFLYMSLFTVCILRSFTSLSWPWIILIGSIVLGIWVNTTVTVTARALRRVTGSQNTGMANSCSSVAPLGAFLGRLSKDGNSYDSEAEVSVMDTSAVPVLAASSVFCVYILLTLLSGSKAAASLFDANRSWILNCLVASLLYGAQVALLINGIRLMLSNIIRMFWDLAKRFISDLWIGLDATALIGYSPRAWHAGFLWASAGAILAAGALMLFRPGYIPLPSLTSCFFAGGVAGVCGNAFGGRRGAHLTGLFTGILSTLLVCLMMLRFGILAELGVSFGETEYGIFGLFLQFICRLFQ